ncbi:MAG: MoaD family protein [Candidatus Bathyarchaeia archaeon]
MPVVTVRVFASLRELLGRNTVDVDAPVEDVKGLISFIADRFQPSFKDAIVDPKAGEVWKGFSVLVNGRDIAFLEGLRTKLKDGDIVAFFPPIGGG